MHSFKQSCKKERTSSKNVEEKIIRAAVSEIENKEMTKKISKIKHWDFFKPAK